MNREQFDALTTASIPESIAPADLIASTESIAPAEELMAPSLEPIPPVENHIVSAEPVVTIIAAKEYTSTEGRSARRPLVARVARVTFGFVRAAYSRVAFPLSRKPQSTRQ